MKIIEGKFKGRKIAYKGRKGRRVTGEKVRKAVFDILKNLIDFKGIKVCDLFAGSGMYGIEAVSRLAKEVWFVDRDKKAIKEIEENLKKLETSNWQLVISDYEKFVNTTREKFNLVFADPPYFDFDFSQFNSVYKILEEDGIFVLEYSSKIKIDNFMGLEKIVEKKYGDTKVAIFKKIKN